MDPEEKRLKLEQDILSVMEEKLTIGEMSGERAQAIARMVLEKLHPPLTLEQIYVIAPTLDDEFSELTAAVLPVLQEHDEKIRTVVASHVEKLLRSGNFDEALEALKEAKK